MATETREPTEIVAGDTLAFERSLADYPATDGWSLTYFLRGGAQEITFTSTASGTSHAVSVAASDTAAWQPLDYSLAGYAISGSERHCIYLATLTVRPNLAAAVGDLPQKTFAQQMIEALEKVMLARAQGAELEESAIGETRWKYASTQSLREEHGYWVSIRRGEIAMERARMGLPTGYKVKASFNVVESGTQLGVQPFTKQ